MRKGEHVSLAIATGLGNPFQKSVSETIQAVHHVVNGLL
jgi:hypothetical protein